MAINAFFSCHIRHLNPLKTHPEWITKTDGKMVNDLDYVNIKFIVSEKDHSKIEQKNNNYINVFCYEDYLVYPVHVSDKKFEKCMDLLLISDENKLHYVSTKDFNWFMCNKAKNKNKNLFCRYFADNVLIVKKF